MPDKNPKYYVGDSDLGKGEQGRSQKEVEAAEYRKLAADQQEKLLNETAKRYGMPDMELENFLRVNYENEKSKEYIVNGAILTCTNCTQKDITYKGQIFQCPVEQDASIEREVDISKYKDKILKRLVVTENPTSEINGLKYATTADVEKKQNIPFFGNCDRLPDNVREKQMFYGLSGDEYKDGTCKLLMNLESEWDNYEIGQNFLEFEDDDNIDKTGITMTSILFCKHGGFVYPVTSGQAIYINYRKEFTYIDKDGNTVVRVWTISDEEFLDCDALTLEEIKSICKYHNPVLVDMGFADGIYNYCIENKLNPKILLATLGQEQGWCREGNYERAFGVGPGGKPVSFLDSGSGIAKAGQTFIDSYNKGLRAESLVLAGINCDKGPDYTETYAQLKENMNEWQCNNRGYVAYMEKGQDIECVNAAMYAKLCYTPWVDFPPANSHQLET